MERCKKIFVSSSMHFEKDFVNFISLNAFEDIPRRRVLKYLAERWSFNLLIRMTGVLG